MSRVKPMRKKNAKKADLSKVKSILKYILPILAGVAAFTVLMLALCFYNYKIGTINKFTVFMGWFAVALGAFVCGLFAHRKLGGRGFAVGGIYGIVFCLPIAEIFSLLSDGDLSQLYIIIPVCVLCSLLGGVASAQMKN